MSDIAMAFDFGMARIGIAVGQQITQSATPVAIIRARDGIPAWDELDKIMEEWAPIHLVVGLPLNMDDTPSEMARLATKFANRLNGRYQKKVHLVDERLSTFEAREQTDSELVDAVAAKLILETWLKDYSAES